jgi:DNA-binding response OmpR family regulator
MPEKDIILVVDDNENNRAIFETYLEMQGFAVFFTENDNQLLQKTRQIMPDVILLNITVPATDDCLIFEKLKNDPDLFEIPTIALTVKFSPKTLVNDLRFMADDVLVKPFDVEEFSQKIKHLIKIRKNRSAVELNTTEMKKNPNAFDVNFKMQTKQATIFQKNFALTLFNGSTDIRP